MVVASYRLQVDGRDVTDKWKRERRLLSVEVLDKLGASDDSCTLELDDRAPHIAWPPAGAQLHVWLGASASDLYDLGTYTVDTPEASGPPHRLHVTAHASSFVAGKSLPMHTQRSRLWEKVSLADLVETIAADHGLTAKVAIALQGKIAGTLEQRDEADLSFLQRVAERFGAKVRVRAGTLELLPAGRLIPAPMTLGTKDIESWSAPLGERLKPGKVVARFFAPAAGKSGEVSVGSAEPTVVLGELFDTRDAAKSAAESALQDRERSSAMLNLSLTSLRTDIGAGVPLAVSGLRSEVDGMWTAVEVRHFAAGDRARTSISAQRQVT